MSLTIDLLSVEDDITPTPASSNTVPDAPISADTISSEAAPFISLIESLRRAKAALPEESARAIEPTAGSAASSTLGRRREMDGMDGGFERDVKPKESKRSGIPFDVQGLALTFDAIPDRVVSSVYQLAVPRPILRSFISSETSDVSSMSTDDRDGRDRVDAASITSLLSHERPKGSRRSSKVRFSDELLPSANSSPGLMALRGNGQGSSGTGQVNVSMDSLALRPVKEGEMVSAGASLTSPISPSLAYRKAKMLRHRSSTNSLHHYHSRRSSGASAASTDNLTSPSRSRFSGEDMFKPQPLPYRKLEKVLARLSVESSTYSATSSANASDLVARDSLSSLEPPASASSTSSFARPRRRRSTPDSLRSSLVGGSACSAIGRGSVFSVKSSNDSFSRPVSPLQLGDTENAIPAINRQAFTDAFMISPRSLPTPVAPDLSIFADMSAVPDYPPPDIPLPPPPSTMPIIDHREKCPSISSLSSLQVHKGHHRDGSDASIEMVFPLPPKRVSATIDAACVELGAAPNDEPPGPASADINEMDAADEADSEEDAIPETEEEAALACLGESGDIRAPSAAGSVAVETGCEDTRKSRSSSRRTSRGGPRSPSPAVSDVMAQALEVLRRRKSSVYPYANVEDDSDLDVAAPLQEAALKSRILSPNSRLLKTRSPSPIKPGSYTTRRGSSISIASLRSGIGLTSGKGWSGSESEEEEWTSTSRLQVRRVRKGIPSAFRPPPLRPTWAKQADRLSSQSTSTVASTAESDLSSASTALMTPSVSTEGALGYMGLGMSKVGQPVRRISSEVRVGKARFGWKLDSINRPTSTPEASEPGPKTRRASSSATVLPTPTRHVEGWGAPEKMLDEPHSPPEPRRQIKRNSNTKSLSNLPRIVGDDTDPEGGLTAPASASSSHVTTPIKQYFYTSAADLSVNLPSVPSLAALLARTNATFPFPRIVSEPTKSQLDMAKSGKAPRIAARNSQLQLKPRVGTSGEEEQCAACKFF